MYCKNCSAFNDDSARFCIQCGESCNAPIEATVSQSNIQHNINCPNCHSTNLHPVTENNVTSSGGGYGAGKGCLGFLCLGPIGLLCGACGSKQKINSYNQNFWMCGNCGYKFQTQQDVEDARYKEEEVKKQQNAQTESILQKTYFLFGAGLVLISLISLIYNFFWLYNSLHRWSSDYPQGALYFAAGMIWFSFAFIIFSIIITSTAKQKQPECQINKNSSPQIIISYIFFILTLILTIFSFFDNYQQDLVSYIINILFRFAISFSFIYSSHKKQHHEHSSIRLASATLFGYSFVMLIEWVNSAMKTTNRGNDTLIAAVAVGSWAQIIILISIPILLVINHIIKANKK